MIEEKCSSVVNELVMLTTGGAEDDILGVSIILHSSLIDPVNKPSAICRCTL
jgi:hypothetical protein